MTSSSKKAKHLAFDNFYVSLGTTVFLYIAFFFIPTWLSGFIEYKFGFAIAGILLLASQLNTSRLARIKNRKR